MVAGISIVQKEVVTASITIKIYRPCNYGAMGQNAIIANLPIIARKRAGIDTIGHAIAIGIGICITTATDARSGLVGVSGALVSAIDHTIAITVIIGGCRTLVLAIGRAIAVGIDIGVASAPIGHTI